MKHFFTTIVLFLSVCSISGQNYGNVNINFGPGGAGSGIDSVVYRQDSAFFYAGDSVWFSGITAPASFDGDILYVTKEGDNATAQKGNYFKPFLTIQGAINSASAGDLIIVYPGVYSESINFSEKRLNYYFNSNAQCVGCRFVGDNTAKVFGKGVFSLSGSALFAGPATATNNSYYLEADSLRLEAGLFADIAFDFVLNARYVKLTGGMGTYGNPTDTSRTFSCIVNSDIFHWTDWGLVYGNNPRRFIHLKAKKAIYDQGGFQSAPHVHGNNGTTILEFDEIIDNNGTAGDMFYWDNTANVNLANWHFEVKAKKWITDDRLFYYVANTNPSANISGAFYKFDFEHLVYTDTTGFVFGGTNTFTRNTRLPIIFEGNYYFTGNGGMVRQWNTTAWNLNCIFRGRYETLSTTKSPFHFRSIGANKVNFDNAQIIVPTSAIATLPAIAGHNVGQNIYVRNLNTNSTIKDAEININYLDFLGRTQQYEVTSTSTLSFYSPSTLILGDNTSGAVSTTIPACSAALAGWKFSAVREDNSGNTWTLLTAAANDFWYNGAAQSTLTLAGQREVQCECGLNGATYYWMRTTQSTAGGSGTVTSVALSVPSGLSVTGSPVTSSGTLAIATTLNGPVKGTGSGFTASAINLASEVTGNLPVGNLNGGIGASSSTFWAGDGTWKTPPSSSTVTGTYTPTVTAITGVAIDTVQEVIQHNYTVQDSFVTVYGKCRISIAPANAGLLSEFRITQPPGYVRAFGNAYKQVYSQVQIYNDVSSGSIEPNATMPQTYGFINLSSPDRLCVAVMNRTSPPTINDYLVDYYFRYHL